MTVTKGATRETLREAARRIAPYVHRTPVLRSTAIDQAVGVPVAFKCENFQKVGAFKFRGACNAVFSLTDAEARAGVITHSSGNHAAAVALAARLRGIDALIVMPDDASAVKVAAVKSYGATIHTCAPGEAARTAAVNALQAEQPRTFVHPYDNHHIISGQGTAALEMLEDYAGLDTLVAPIGGGGLLAGTALAATTRNGIRCFGAEPAQADDAKRSFDAGRIIPVEHPETIADGLRTSVGVRNFPIIREHVSDILTVSEDGIVAAMRLIWERMKLVVEPSGAVPLAALLENGAPIETQSIGLIISGGNTDLDALPWLKRR